MQDQITNLSISLQTAPGQMLQGTQLVAQLSFTAASDQHSAFVPLLIDSITALKPGASYYVNNITHPATIVVVQDVPLLVASISTNRTRDITAFGRLGTIYQLQYTTDLSTVPAWFPYLTYTQTNGQMMFQVDSTNSIIFYRLFQP
jgi:hypothetical protein